MIIPNLCKHLSNATRVLLVLAAMIPGAVAADDPELAAHYSFDEGTGAVAHDRSGNGNDGTITAAEWVRSGDGYALAFNGKDSVVDCGNAPALDITDAITVSAWVNPAALPTLPSEWIIVGKQQDYYALCYYMTGACWWYTSGGDNACQSPVSVGQWHHLAGTFDGRTMALYVDGELMLAKPTKYPAIKSRSALSLYIGPAPFSGMIDEVKVYRRALDAAEIQAQYAAEQTSKLTPTTAVTDAAILQGDGFTMKVGRGGGMELTLGNDSCFFESAFSEPGMTIGWNRFSEQPDASNWKIRRRHSRRRKSVVIRARTAHYKLERRVRLEQGRVRVQDRLTNTSDTPVGVMIDNHVVTPEPFDECLLGGMPDRASAETATNPTIYIAMAHSRVGIVAEDNISRLQFEAASGLNRATASIRHLGLAPGKSRTLEWSIYPLPETADYFTMVNRIRTDWQANFPVDGPMEFGEVYPERYGRPVLLRQAFERKPVKFYALTRMFEYDIARMPRETYKQHVQKTMTLLKDADPDIKVFASLEAFCPSLLYYPGRIEGGEKLDAFIAGHPGGSVVTLPAELTAYLDRANESASWPDSLYRNADGLVSMEIYRPGTATMTSLYAFPATGNYQHRHLMDQVRYLIDVVGVDGIYFDGLGAMAGGSHYGAWDGVTVDIDPATGRITRKYTNSNLAGIEAKAEIADYILSRGRAMIGNGGNAGVREEQDVPVFRFVENDPVDFEPGDKPPLNPRLCSLQLGSPIALMGRWGGAETIYQAVISYLRHGLVCYYYNTNFPATGEGSGDYGPFRHMFPITPVALHEGWVHGKERIITCVSGNYTWQNEKKPVVYLFDSTGREKPHQFVITKADNHWRIDVRLKDWQEIAAIVQETQ